MTAAASPARAAMRRPLRMAHRGASARAPENTVTAFTEAIRLGADAIELDVHLSADGVPVVIHDDTVDRTTNGRGPVASHTASELKKLDAGAWFSSRFKGERIPTLEETLECLRGRCGVNVEIKDPPRRRPATTPGPADDPAALARAVGRAVARAQFHDLLIVSSFSSRALQQARAAMPRVPLGLLASRSLHGLRRAHRRVGLYSVHPNVRLAGRRRVRLIASLGLVTIFWTVNDLRVMRRLLAIGGDGLMTDDPALFQELSGVPARGNR